MKNNAEHGSNINTTSRFKDPKTPKNYAKQQFEGTISILEGTQKSQMTNLNHIRQSINYDQHNNSQLYDHHQYEIFSDMQTRNSQQRMP